MAENASNTEQSRRRTLQLGELLQIENLLTDSQLREALVYQKTHGGRLGHCLVKLGFVSEVDVTAMLSRLHGVPFIDLSLFEVDPELSRILPRDMARRYQVIPLSLVGSTLSVATADPRNFVILDELKFMTGFTIQPLLAPETQIHEAVERYYVSTRGEDLKQAVQDLVDASAEGTNLEMLEEPDESVDVASLEKESDEAPIIRLVNLILMDAVKRGASDIHVEPYEREFRVRYRVDGVLETTMTPPLRLREALTSRIKIMAKLDISEKRLPQDGRIKIRMNISGKTKEMDFRVSSLPTLFGEKVVMRLLDKESLMLDMTRLGLEPESMEKFTRAISKPYGMVLVVGPTGSGKTNTLYSAISQMNRPDVNIMTAEDPVEFNLPGINQVNMRDQIGLNFAAALRSFLRQDPNVILVGEIRDLETAEIAVKASLTGHLVLSTLHTNDAPGTVTRLSSMGIEPFLVATSVNLVCAQRLVRRVCKECAQEQNIPEHVLIEAGVAKEELATFKPMKGAGCSTCNNTGYKGRIGLYEVMEMSEKLRDIVLANGSAIEIRRKAVEAGMIGLRQSGLMKVRSGVTTLEEVLRETVR